MAFQSLYRAARPKRFIDVLGQEHITTILKNQISAARPSHAYIFSGSRGTGKTTTARIFARAVNCLSPVDGEPCGKCEACLRTERDCPDIIEMDAASNTSVDDIRPLIEKARFLPLELKTKVYIIDEAHELSEKAVNALLKTLEEPPAHVVFILATTETQRIPATILSRCQRFDFHRIGVENIVKCVSEAVGSMGATIEREGLLAIARASEGGMRDALTLAEQCVSFCGNNVTAADVYSVLGSMEGDFLFEVADTLLSGDRAGALRALDRVMDEGRDMAVFARDLAAHFRALSVAKLCGECADILDCTEDAMAKYIAQAKNVSEAALLRAVELLIAASADIRYSPLPRVQLECAFIRATSPEEESKQTPELLLERIEKLEAKLAKGAFVQAQPAQAPARSDDAPPWDVPAPSAGAGRTTDEPSPSREAAAQVVRAQVERAQGEREQDGQSKAVKAPSDAMGIWTAAQEHMRKVNPTLAMLAKKATGAELSGNTLTVRFQRANVYEAFMKASDEATTGAVSKVRPDTVARFELEGAKAKATDGDLEARARSVLGDIEIIDS